MECWISKRSESKFDHFGAGHASTSISAALGMAIARDRKGENYKCVLLLEMEHNWRNGIRSYKSCRSLTKYPFSCSINDNDMSISPPVGALSSYLNKVRVVPIAIFVR